MEIVIQILKEQGRKNKWLADQIGVHRTLLQHWFAGRRTMPNKYKKKISNTLGIPEEVLFPRIAHNHKDLVAEVTDD